MVVGCPKCKTKLKVLDEKIKPEGTRFRCPKCAAALLIKRPAQKPAQTLTQKIVPPQPPGPSVQAPKPTVSPGKVIPPKAEPPKAKPQVAPHIAPPAVPPKVPLAKPLRIEPPLAQKPIVPEEPVVEKLAISTAAPVSEERKVLLAYAGKETLERLKKIVSSAGFAVSVAEDGITAMVKAMNERPLAAFVDVAIPKISGYEISKRLKAGRDTLDIKTFLISSEMDALRIRKGSANSYGAEDYLDANISDKDLLRVLSLLSVQKAAPTFDVPEEKAPVETPVKPSVPLTTTVQADPEVERARRLVRAMLSDIELYSPQKVQEAIISGNYEVAFGKELKDGLKHYENRISLEVRKKKDYLREELDKYLEKRKKALSL